MKRQSLATTMIPKTEFVKLRKWVMSWLQRNIDANGHAHIQHNLDECRIYFSSDMKPFAGMSHHARDVAIVHFWDSLLNNKLVEKLVDPRGSVYYHLPGKPAFHPSVGAMFKLLEQGAIDLVTGFFCDPYDSQNIPEGK